MREALLFGTIASSGLVAGALAGVRIRLPERALAALLAFASGALITALAFELFLDAYEHAGVWLAGAGLVAGAVVFTAVSAWLDRKAAGPGREPEEEAGSAKLDTDAAAVDTARSASAAGSAAGLALLAAVILDGVPENLALGISLEAGTGGIVLLVAIFLSNFPEALVGAASMQEQGRSAGYAVGTWSVAAVVLVAAVVVGRTWLAGSSPEVASLPLSFAGGAVLASLADTLMPEAYEKGGPAVALATTGGFLVSFLLAAA